MKKQKMISEEERVEVRGLVKEKNERSLASVVPWYVLWLMNEVLNVQDAVIQITPSDICELFQDGGMICGFDNSVDATQQGTDLCRKLAEAGVNFAEKCCMANSKSVINFTNENNIHDAQQLTSLLCGDASSGKLTPYPKGFCYAMWKERLKVLRVFYGLEVEPDNCMRQENG